MALSARNVIRQSKLYTELAEMMPEQDVLSTCGDFNWDLIKPTVESMVSAINYLEYMMVDVIPCELMCMICPVHVIMGLATQFGSDNIFVRKLNCMQLMRTHRVSKAAVTIYVQSPEIVKYLGDKCLTRHITKCLGVAAQIGDLPFIKYALQLCECTLLLTVLQVAASFGNTNIIQHYIHSDELDRILNDHDMPDAMSIARCAFLSGNFKALQILATRFHLDGYILSKYGAIEYTCNKWGSHVYYGNELSTTGVAGLNIAIKYGVSIDMSIMHPAIVANDIEFVRILHDQDGYFGDNTNIIAGIDASLQMTQLIHDIDKDALLQTYNNHIFVNKWCKLDTIRLDRIRTACMQSDDSFKFESEIYAQCGRPIDELRKIISWSEPPQSSAVQYVISDDEEHTLLCLDAVYNAQCKFHVEALHCMAIAGHVKCFKYICDRMDVPAMITLPHTVIESRNNTMIDCLKIWRSFGSIWSTNACTDAITSECLPYLVYAITTGADHSTCIRAAMNASRPVYLMYLYTSGLINIYDIDIDQCSPQCDIYVCSVRNISSAVAACN
jgi:hypothetical protein